MKKFWLISLFLASVVWFAVTLTNNRDTDGKPQANVPNAKYGGTLVVGLSDDVDSFNPLFNETASAQEITHLLLIGLADLNEHSEFVPALASSWEFSTDNLSLTYQMRPDAQWSDGVAVTAEDVKFTFDSMMDPQVATPRQGATEYLESVEAIDLHTVVFRFSQAYPDQMFDTAVEILPKHILDGVAPSALRAHDFGTNPISSGPFKLKKWVHQQYIELEPNDLYFGGRPYLERLLFKVVPDKSSLLMQLMNGEVDMMLNIPPDEAKRITQENPEINLYPVAGRLYYYMGYNTKHPLFDNAEVRRALTMAIDRQSIIKALLYGFGESCLGPVSPMVTWAYNQEIDEVDFDPEESTELLHTHGWRDLDKDGWLEKDGQQFEFTLKTNWGNDLRSDVAVIIQEQLKKVGVKVEIETMERSAMITELRADNFEAYMGGWNTSINVDLTPLFHSSATDMFNLVKYSNPAVDSLIEQGREELNREKAGDIWQEAQRLIYEDQPYTFLFWKARIVGVRRDFKQVTPIPLSTLYGIEKWYRDGTR